MEQYFNASYLKQILNKNKKIVYPILGFLILIAAALFFYFYYIPKQQDKAASEMALAELNFMQGNYTLAYEGDSKNKGFKQLKNKYFFNKTNNLVFYYSGICQMNMGKFSEAIEDLKKFSTSNDELQTLSYSLLGDCYAETGKMNEAVSYYEKASENSKNIELAPTLLYKAATAYHHNNNAKKALELIDKLKINYPNSTYSQKADLIKASIE
ncbi:MAG: tetratricopeptide repeat protein [Chitinophagales bacterium]|jgi:tetratricopeptide (TPR) repeat protein|nr:tetratricopeptide repeat protein [Chitinophagales bacterium]